jgi:hypothetical protein
LFEITPCIPLKINRRFGETYCLHRHEAGKQAALLAKCFMLISCLAYSSTMMMEATYYSDMSVHFQRTTRLYIPEDRTFKELVTGFFVEL